MPQADIGIFGGSGFYSFVEGLTSYEVQTPYGPPSAPVSVGTLDGRPVLIALAARVGPARLIDNTTIEG